MDQNINERVETLEGTVAAIQNTINLYSPAIERSIHITTWLVTIVSSIIGCLLAIIAIAIIKAR